MAKRTTNNQSLRQVIEELIDAYRLSDKLNQARVIS